MKIKVALIFFFLSANLQAQNYRDSACATSSLGLTAYPYTYKTNIDDATVAMGPSFLLKERRLGFQVGLLYDIRKYTYYSHVTHVQIDTVKGFNLFLPVLFHYSYLTKNTTSWFLTSGLVFGGRYYINERNLTDTGSGMNIIFGSGVSFELVRSIDARITATMRYNGNMFLGLILDFNVFHFE